MLILNKNLTIVLAVRGGRNNIIIFFGMWV